MSPEAELPRRTRFVEGFWRGSASIARAFGFWSTLERPRAGDGGSRACVPSGLSGDTLRHCLACPSLLGAVRDPLLAFIS